MQVLSLGQKDPLEKGMATQSSILAWRTPWTQEPESQTQLKRLSTHASTHISLSLSLSLSLYIYIYIYIYIYTHLTSLVGVGGNGDIGQRAQTFC